MENDIEDRIQNPNPIPDIRETSFNDGIFNLTFKSQNVRSLNVSTRNTLTTEKIYAITQSKEDIIFICDTRLNEEQQKPAINDIKKKLFILGYDIIVNSKTSLRGVCILYKKSLNLEVLDILRDEDNNLILCKFWQNNNIFIVGSIYGTNDNNPLFFANLKNMIELLSGPNIQSIPIILGGDWNATIDNSNLESNIDVINMRNIPSR